MYKYRYKFDCSKHDVVINLPEHMRDINNRHTMFMHPSESFGDTIINVNYENGISYMLVKANNDVFVWSTDKIIPSGQPNHFVFEIEPQA